MLSKKTLPLKNRSNNSGKLKLYIKTVQIARSFRIIIGNNSQYLDGNNSYNKYECNMIILTIAMPAEEVTSSKKQK